MDQSKKQTWRPVLQQREGRKALTRERVKKNNGKYKEKNRKGASRRAEMES